MSDFSSDYKDLLSTFNLMNPLERNHKIDGLHTDAQSFDFAENNDEGKNEPGDGIIFTDTQCLADKFSLSSKRVLSILTNFINDAQERGFEWRLLDVSESRWKKLLSADKSPYSYHKVLDTFAATSSWETDADTCLFIIGGNDVIPIKQRVDSSDYRDFLTDEDIYYCFPLDFDLEDELLDNITEESTPEQISSFLMQNAKFNVSRLPLDSRKIEYNIDDTIEHYFKRVSECFGIIPVNNIQFTTARQWEKASDYIAQGLPLLELENKPGLIKNGIFLSPLVDIDNVGSTAEYYSSMQKADLLLFNLHGTDEYGKSAYFGDNGNPNQHVQPRAFDIESLDYFNGSIINSMACFGAKYNNSGQSLLLSSIYCNTLLFAGSSNLAWGQQSSELPCGCSEAFLRIYTGLLLEGIPAGKAFLQSKCDYLAYFMPIDGFDKAYFTIREFNLFGDPTLSCQCLSNSKSLSIPDYSLTFMRNPKGAIHSRYGITAMSVLDEVYETVRDAVDNNLREISVRLGHYLHNDLGYNDVKLSKIEKISNNKSGKEYRFTYSFEQLFNRGCIEVLTNSKGESISVFYTK